MMRPFLDHLGLSLIGAVGLGFGFRLLVFIGFLFHFRYLTHSLGSCDCKECVRTGVVFSEVLSIFRPVSVDGPVGSDVEVVSVVILFILSGVGRAIFTLGLLGQQQ